MQFTMDADEKTFYRVVKEEIEKDIDPLDLVYPQEVPVFDKYDEYLPEQLIRKGFALGVLNLDDVRKRIREWGNEE